MIDKFTRHVGTGHRVYQAVWFICSAIFLESRLPWPSLFKAALLRVFGAKIGTAVVLRPGIYVKTPRLLVVGSHVWLGRGVIVDNDEAIIIGSNVCISQEAALISGSHNYYSEKFDYFGHPIVIKDNCWLAARAILLAGSEIGEHSFVGPGVVVRGKVASYTRMNLAQVSYQKVSDRNLLP